MPKKKKALARNPDRRKPGHYNAVLIEDLKSDFKFVFEGMEGVKKEVIERMDQRFEDLEAILKVHDYTLNSLKVKMQAFDDRTIKIHGTQHLHTERFDKVLEMLQSAAR